MHLLSVNKWRQFVKPVLSVVVCIAIFVATWMALTNTQERSGGEQAKALKDAMRRAAVSCYAIEGRYPPSLEYIVDNYGVVVNEEKFIVSYSAFAENIMPSLRVLERGKEAIDESDDDDY